jgi:hypothetical protein
MSAYLLDIEEQIILFDVDIQITKNSGLCLPSGPRVLHPICRQAKAMRVEQLEVFGCFSTKDRAEC